MTDQIAVDLLRQELSRMRGRIAFFYGCADDSTLPAESREASRRVAEALSRMIELFSLKAPPDRHHQVQPGSFLSY